MKRLIFLLLGAAPGLAAAQVPQDLYAHGVAARMSGDNNRAVILLEQVVADDNGNADAQLQLGLALLNLGRLDEAEAAFRRTLAIAPDYADARIGIARVEQRRGRIDAAVSELNMIGSDNSEASVLRQQLRQHTDIQRWRLDFDGGYSWLEGSQPDWQEVAMRLAYRASAASTVSGGLEIARRFEVTDVYGELRVDNRFRPGLDGYVLLGATPNSDFRPQWHLGAGGAVRVRNGGSATVLTLDARQARYNDGDIQTLNPGIDQYLAKGKIWVGARWINIFDENGKHRAGWLLRGDALATPDLRLFVGAANAPDISEGIVIDTFSLFGGLAYDLNERTNLRMSLAHEDRETGSDRLQVSLGAGWKF